MIYAIMDDIAVIEKLKLADMAALDGAISNIRIFKLGKIDKALCFAVNVSGLKTDSDLTRVPFYKVMQGEHSNSKLLAASFLTISYFA